MSFCQSLSSADDPVDLVEGGERRQGSRGNGQRRRDAGRAGGAEEGVVLTHSNAFLFFVRPSDVGAGETRRSRPVGAGEIKHVFEINHFC